MGAGPYLPVLRGSVECCLWPNTFAVDPRLLGHKGLCYPGRSKIHNNRRPGFLLWWDKELPKEM